MPLSGVACPFQTADGQTLQLSLNTSSDSVKSRMARRSKSAEEPMDSSRRKFRKPGTVDRDRLIGQNTVFEDRRPVLQPEATLVAGEGAFPFHPLHPSERFSGAATPLDSSAAGPSGAVDHSRRGLHVGDGFRSAGAGRQYCRRH